MSFPIGIRPNSANQPRPSMMVASAPLKAELTCDQNQTNPPRASSAGFFLEKVFYKVAPCLHRSGLVRLFHQLEIQHLFFDIGARYLESDGIAQSVALFGALADDRICFLVEIPVVVAEIADIDHAFGFRLLFFDIDAPFRNAGDDAIKGLADLVSHVFDLLQLDRGALCLRGADLAVGRMLGDLAEGDDVAVAERLAIQMFCQDAMDEEVGIAADRRREVRIIIKCQAEVADILCRIDGLLHGADHGCGKESLMRRSLDLFEEALDVLRLSLSLCLYAKYSRALCEFRELCHTLWIGQVMDAIDGSGVARTAIFLSRHG